MSLLSRKYLHLAHFALPSVILLLFLTLNMFLYRGGHASGFLGTSYNFAQRLEGYRPGGQRYSFLLNFVSDLGRTRTYSGDSNIFSAILFCATLSTTGFSLLIFISKLDGEKAHPKILERNYGILKTLCRISAVCFIAVGWAPQDAHHVFLILHLFSVNAAFGSIMAICVMVISIYQRHRRLSRKYPVICLLLLGALFAYLVTIIIWYFTRSMSAYFVLVIGQKIIVYLTAICLSVFEGVLRRLSQEQL